MEGLETEMKANMKWAIELPSGEFIILDSIRDLVSLGSGKLLRVKFVHQGKGN